MSVIQRRTFFGKVGTGEELIEHLTKGNEMLEQLGTGELTFKVLSDYQSGRTDRVVVEVEAETVAEIEASMASVIEHNPAAVGEFRNWVESLNDMIHYAEVDYWQVH